VVAAEHTKKEEIKNKSSGLWGGKNRVNNKNKL
jgi:hypothetical protein